MDEVGDEPGWLDLSPSTRHRLVPFETPSLTPQFLHSAQECDDVLTAQHAHRLVVGHHEKLVYSVPIHLLQGVSRFLIRAYAHQIVQRERGRACNLIAAEMFFFEHPTVPF